MPARSRVSSSKKTSSEKTKQSSKSKKKDSSKKASVKPRSRASSRRTSRGFLKTWIDPLLSINHSKAAGERFFLLWSVIWMTLVFFVIVTQIYEQFDSNAYMALGLIVGLPPMLYPVFRPLGGDAELPFWERYSTKANVWIWIMSFAANYFWTHYFYQVLGASYTFTAWRVNDVPVCLFFMTHSYFMFYHTISTIMLRWLWRKFDQRVSIASLVVVTLCVAVLGYLLAFMEVWTLENFPYYQQVDVWSMYVYGSVFYTLYFLCSFPLFYRIDEVNYSNQRRGSAWTLTQATMEGLANAYLITQVLDFWRLWIGPIHDGKTVTSEVSFIN